MTYLLVAVWLSTSAGLFGPKSTMESAYYGEFEKVSQCAEGARIAAQKKLLGDRQGFFLCVPKPAAT